MRNGEQKVARAYVLYREERRKERDQAAKIIYTAWRSQFLSTPIDGVYVIPKAGAAKTFAANLETRSDMRVRVTEYELVSPGGLEDAELGEWATRVKNQLNSVSLGRGKEADADGLRALETLAGCPVLAKATATRIKELVEMVRAAKLDRLELKRRIEILNVEIEDESLISPRRASPTLV